MTKYLISALIVLTLSVSNAFAGKVKTFDEMDENHDGFISKSEAQDNEDFRENWNSADKDNDNKLDAAEFSAFEGRERFQPADDMEEPEIGAAPTTK